MNRSILSVFATCVSMMASASAALVTHYTFEGNANDSVGSNNLLTTGTVTYVSAGQPGLGQAARVADNPDNNNAAVSYLSDTSFGGLTTVDDFTLSIWVNQDFVHANFYNDIVALDDGPETQAIELMIVPSSTQVVLAMNSEGSGTISAPSSGSILNEWHHITIVGGTSNVSYYFDGALVGVVNSSPADALTQLYFFRGGQANSGDLRGWNGQIADAQIYNNNLTAQEVTFLFQNPGQVIPEPSVALLGGLGALLLLRRRTR